MIKALILIIILIWPNYRAENSYLRVMTYNIRYANNNPGEEWILRRNDVTEMIRFHKPDVFGLQEALIEQVEFISYEFPGHQLVGVGREDGKNEGEFSPLFISNKFSIEDYGTFWLSETPDTPSIGWDAAFNRIATWALIKEKCSNEKLFVINTHLDHKGITARIESIKLILSKIEEYSNDLPAILIGDFNFTKDSEPYKFIIENELLNDSWKISKYHYGTSVTFNDFGKPLTDLVKIDYIFVSNSIDVIHHAIIGDKFNDKYPSDHMPVMIDFSLN